jgi:hypothetical protein
VAVSKDGPQYRFVIPGTSFEQTRACRSGLQDSIAPAAYRTDRISSRRRAGPASWRSASASARGL